MTQKTEWQTMLEKYPLTCNFSSSEYHKILCSTPPDFLLDYLKTPAMQRLKGISLLCGTDWTHLYKNRFFYSRFDHSLGTALIVWKHTHDKTQTLSALFHDISTPIFSHVGDFRKGDALTQKDTESETEKFINDDKILCDLLKSQNILQEKIKNYHIYPIADNEIPSLSADRLEYMFPSGASLQGSWTLKEIKDVYDDILILKNEDGFDELGFSSIEKAEKYCEKFLETGHILQLNENKLSLQLLADITNLAIKLSIIEESDCTKLSESEVISRFDDFSRKNESADFSHLHKTFRLMTSVKHTEKPLKNHYCVSLKVKQRYINPLVRTSLISSRRLYEISSNAKKLIDDFLAFEDTKYGCVEIL